MSLSPALKPHILLVQHDNQERADLRAFLNAQGFLTTPVSSLARAREVLRSLIYDLAVVDISAPDAQGELSLTCALGKTTEEIIRRVPIISLVASQVVGASIKSFELGADDCLQRPFDKRELALQIRAIWRRLPEDSPEPVVLKFGDFSYDIERQELTKNGQVIRLLTAERDVMAQLAAQPNEWVSRDMLAQNKTYISRAIDLQITRIRRKIEDDTKHPRFIMSSRGGGYMLVVSEIDVVPGKRPRFVDGNYQQREERLRA